MKCLSLQPLQKHLGIITSWATKFIKYILGTAIISKLTSKLTIIYNGFFDFKFPKYDRIIIWSCWQSDRDYQNHSSYATDNFQLIGEFDEFILTDIKFV